jgi:hypothetical protein
MHTVRRDMMVLFQVLVWWPRINVDIASSAHIYAFTIDSLQQSISFKNESSLGELAYVYDMQFSSLIHNRVRFPRINYQTFY